MLLARANRPFVRLGSWIDSGGRRTRMRCAASLAVFLLVLPFSRVNILVDVDPCGLGLQRHPVGVTDEAAATSRGRGIPPPSGGSGCTASRPEGLAAESRDVGEESLEPARDPSPRESAPPLPECLFEPRIEEEGGSDEILPGDPESGFPGPGGSSSGRDRLPPSHVASARGRGLYILYSTYLC